MRFTTSSTCAPTRPGRPPGLLRDSPARARSRMSTPSWQTGAQTTALSATATSAKTSSRSRACSESPLRCTTSPTRTSTVRTPGPHLVQRTSRVQTIEPAPPTVRCINKIKIKSSVRETGRNFFVASQSFLIFQSRSPRINGSADRSELSATGRVYSINRSVIKFEYLPSSLGIPPLAINLLSAAV